MAETKDSAWGCVGILLAPISIVLAGYVTSLFWLWFIVSYTDVRPLGVARSIGVSCLVAMFRRRNFKKPKPEREYPFHLREIYEICGLLMILGVGWIAQRFL
jgi:hypothetical protein